MPIIEKTVIICRCLQCNWEWQPRQPVEQIKMCPRCRTIYWNEPKVQAWQRKLEEGK